MSIYGISFICPICMCRKFIKDEEQNETYGTYICVSCGEEHEYYELDIEEYEV